MEEITWHVFWDCPKLEIFFKIFFGVMGQTKMPFTKEKKTKEKHNFRGSHH
jgi:hypothetical protein